MLDDPRRGPFGGRRSSESEGDSRTDDVIERAARDLTRGEPPRRLRHEIRARIGGRRRASLPIWIPAFAGAGAIVIAVVIVQRSATPVALPTARQVALTTPVTLTPVDATDIERSEQSERPERFERSERSERQITIPPLAIDPIEMPLMAVTTSSGVMPIEIEDLQIEPLQIQ